MHFEGGFPAVVSVLLQGEAKEQPTLHHIMEMEGGQQLQRSLVAFPQRDS